MNLLRRFKGWVHRSLSAYRLHVYTVRSLPYGIDLEFDIARCGRREIECVFDVGANVGQSVLRFNSYWPNAKIFSFEPVEETFRQLVENTRGFSNVQCENIALGASRGTGIIWLQDKGNSWNSLKEEVNRQETSIGQQEKVEITTLDEFCLENQVNCIDFLKINVEGYELEVLKGADRMLTSRAIQFIYAETTFHMSDSQHTPITKLTDYLEPLSYRCLGIYDKKLGFDTLGQPTYLRWCDALFKLQD
jgi:FkbM family methyltransferase